MHVPEAAYKKRIGTLEAARKAAETPSDFSSAARRKREIDRLQGVIETLRRDSSEQRKHVTRVRAFLRSRAATLLGSDLVDAGLR